MKLLNIFKRKTTSIDTILQNDLCKRMLDKYCKEELDQTTALILIYEIQSGENKETYFKSASMEPAQAILTLTQLLHRIQHEGLADYD